MASQYDTIGDKYNAIKKLPAAILEKENLREAAWPYLGRADRDRDGLRRPRALDLACGTGYYTRELLDWGAGSVLGVDLSSAMVDAAAASLPPGVKQSGQVEFRVGNAADLGPVAGGGTFDLAVGAWLLNYAASEDEMTRMFGAISTNLVAGGAFVGITPHPVEDIDAFAAKTNASERARPGKWGVGVLYKDRLESGEGWKSEVSVPGDENGAPDDEPLMFRTYHLRRSVYEKAARRGGMAGRLEWKEIKLPPQALGTYGAEYWEGYFSNVPHLGILVVEK